MVYGNEQQAWTYEEYVKKYEQLEAELGIKRKVNSDLHKENEEFKSKFVSARAENEKLSEQYNQLHIDFVATKRQLEEDLKKYGKHLADCPAKRRFHIPDCPSCGSRRTRWRHGVGFEHEKSCMDCKGPAWIPEEVFGECTCGLEQALSGG